MKKITLIMSFIGLFIIQSTAQDETVKSQKVTTASASTMRVINSTSNCNNNGIDITVMGGTMFHYPTPLSSIVCNTPVVAYSGWGMHSGGGSAAVLTYTFSRAITCATVTYCWVDIDDIGKITTDGGGIVTLSNACGANITGTTLTSNLTRGNGNVTVTVSSTTPFTKIILTNTGGRSGWGQGNLCNFILNDCPNPNSTGCCPGTNLICNGDFEGLKNCFESRYSGYTGEGILRPGQYAINDYATANKFCKQWTFNQAPCQRTGKGLFINGVTNGVGKKVIWQQQINYNGWAQYRFCAEVLPLNQCCFNVAPKLEMKLTYQSGGQQKTIILNQTSTDNCGWIKYAAFAQAWEGSDGGTGTLSITLDETGIGDGNDFVLDNIALIELKPIDKAIQNQSSVTIAADLSIKATFTGTLPPGIVGLWLITPLDASGNPDPTCPDAQLKWWSTNTNFVNFNGCGLTNTNLPGKVIQGKSYNIYFATYGDCNAWDVVKFKVAYNPANKMMPVVTKEEKVTEKSEPALKDLIKKAQNLIPNKINN
jgi:hypothetical protein